MYFWTLQWSSNKKNYKLTLFLPRKKFADNLFKAAPYRLMLVLHKDNKEIQENHSLLVKVASSSISFGTLSHLGLCFAYFENMPWSLFMIRKYSERCRGKICRSIKSRGTEIGKYYWSEELTILSTLLTSRKHARMIGTYQTDFCKFTCQ